MRSEFFQVPEPRRKFGILPSLRNMKKYKEYMKKIWRIFIVPEPRRKLGLGIFLSSRAYMEETLGRVTPRTSLRSVLRQQPVFEGGGSFEFFQVPRPIWWRKDKNFSKSQSLYTERNNSVILTKKYSQMEPLEEKIVFTTISLRVWKRKDRNFSKSQGLYREGEIGIFPSPRA